MLLKEFYDKAKLQDPVTIPSMLSYSDFLSYIGVFA